MSFEVMDAFFTDMCTTTVLVTPPATCSDQCVIQVQTQPSVCNNNGTTFDDSDDTFSFRFRLSGFNAGLNWVASDGSAGVYNSWYIYTGYPISGGDVSITFTDAADPNCSTTFTFPAPATCSPDCHIEVQVGDAICIDAGTPVDPMDDTYTFTVQVSGWNTGSSNWVANDGLSSTGAYGTEVVMAYPIAAGGQTITISDPTAPDCSAVFTVSAPNTCSDQCELYVEQMDAVCNDNNTPTVIGDDTYTVDVRITAANGANGWSSASGFAALYGEWITLGPFNIADGDVQLLIEDQADAACTISLDLVAPPHCSTACELNAVATEVVCDDAGTPTDPSDDTFTFVLTATGVNTGVNWVANDANQTMAAYGEPVLMGPYPIVAGGISLVIQDSASPDCSTAVEVAAPMTCSFECAIEVEQVGDPICDPNNTFSDASDDTFTVTVIVNGNNTGTNWIAANGQVGAYGVPVVLGPFPITAGVWHIAIQDEADQGCSTTLSVQSPAACSDVCLINPPVITQVLCSDNNTPTDPTDDTFTFEATLDGFNLGDGWTTNVGVVGQYGIPTQFGPFPISQGNIDLVFTDASETTCTEAITVDAPSTCSDQCAISAVANNYLCWDNDTPFDPSDDLFTFDLEVTAINATGANWTGPNGLTGVYNVVLNMGSFPIDNSLAEWVITDVAQSDCSFVLPIEPPAPCSNSCQITATTTNAFCDDNGTPDISSDDTFEYTLTVNGINTGDNWSANNGLTGVYGTPLVLTGNTYAATSLTYTITDNSGACSVLVQVDAPLPELICPEDTDQRAFMGSVQILRGELDTTDFILPEPPCFLALNSTPMQLGDRAMEPVDILTPEQADTSESVYTFYFFSEMDLPPALQSNGNADGVSMLFRGNYSNYTDPCCFSQSYPDRLDLDENLVIENPYVDTTGMFDTEMFLVQRFTQSLKMGQQYSLVATTYGAEVYGKYAWVIVSETDQPLAVTTDEVTSEFSIEQPLRADLTHLNLAWALNNPESLSFLGEAIVEPYCGVDSLYFNDIMTFSGNCDSAFINRTFMMDYAETTDSCEQVITFRRPDYYDVVLPPATYTFQCEDDILLTDEGYPHPDETGYPIIFVGDEYINMQEQTPYFNMSTSYKDIPLFDTSGLTLNLIRE
ncbi:MAG: hypothetical protein R2795_19445 [Saprospiraceae bacterium]